MEERFIDLEKELVMNKQADLVIGESLQIAPVEEEETSAYEGETKEENQIY